MSDLFKLVTEKALENTDTVIAEKVHPVLGALGIASLAASAVPTINAVKKIDNIKNYFTKSESNMGKAVEAKQLKTGYGIAYIDSKGNKLIKKGGDISILANNPGNIALPKSGFGPKNKQKFKNLGAIGWFVGKTNVFAIFPDEETGKKALYTWFFSGDRDSWTIERVMNVYAPASENDIDKYLKFIEKHGISPENKLSDLSERQQDILISAIIKMEGKNPVKSEQFIPAEPKLTNDVQKVSVKESLENNVDILTKAKNYFGLTTSISEAGYILPNGTMLDFSGKKFGGSPNRRSMDHREISSAFDSEEITMSDIVELGCIRMDGDLGYVSMAILPTNAQFETLENIMYKKGHIDVECAKNITDWYNNHNLFYKEYNGYNFERVKKDIINYYSNKPLSKLQVFHENNLNNINSKSEKIEMGDKELNRFYKWLGTSKVVDKQGRPLVVYHGTNAIFQKFSKKFFGHYQELGEGFYFTADESDANDYGTIIIPFYLRIENPFIASKEQLQSFKDYTKLDFEVDSIKEIEDIIDLVERYGKKRFSKVLQTLGFDGIILYGQYVVFNANQMKAAEYGNDGHYRRSSNNFNESITLNEGAIPMWDDNIEDYITGAFYCFTGNELQSILDNNLHHEDARVIYEFNKGVYLLTESINAIHNQILEMAIINTKLFDSLGDIKQIKEENEGQVTLICEEARKYLDLITFKIFRNMETDTDEQFLEFLVRLPDNWTDDYSEGFACKLNNTTWAICRYNELNKIKQIPIFNGKEWISLKEINERLPEDEEELNESHEEVKKIIAYHGSQQKRIKFNKDKVLYLTRDYNQAKSYAIREWDEGLIEGEIPVIFKFEVSIKKPFITDGSEDSFFDFCDEMMVKEGRKNELISQGYDSIIHNDFIGVFFENQLKLLDTEILPWNPKYYYPEDGGINWEEKEDYYYFNEYDNEDLNESVEEDDNKTWIDIEDIMSEYQIQDVLSLFQEENPWNPLIDAGQYKKALKEFVKTGKLLRTLTSLIENWFEIIVRNTQILKITTELSGHSTWFPLDEVKDYNFGDDELSYQEFLLDNKVEKGASEYEIGSLILNKKGFYEKMVLPDGSDAISDYGLKPLYDIIYEYKEGMTAEEVLVLINKALDVVHCRGDLASAFIKGGRDTLTSISNESKKEIKKPLNESKQLNKKVIAYHGSQTDKLQFMKNHALYLTDNYELAHEFATKDGDGGLIDGEIATLYTCELNLKKVYETHSEAEYDTDFIDISLDRQKWLDKGYNAIIIHPTEGSKTTYYIMLNPEDVKIIDKKVISSLNEMAYPSNFNMDEFKSIKSFQGKLDYCSGKLEKISSGSSRVVFKVDDKKVIKIAKNKKGLAQNEEEFNMVNDGYRCAILAQCFDADEDNFFWIEMELAKKCSIKEFKRIAGIDFQRFCFLIRKTFESNKYPMMKLDSYTDEDKAFMSSSEFWADVHDYIGSFDIPVGDMCKLSSWGIVDDELKVIDFGLSDDIFNSYYKK